MLPDTLPTALRGPVDYKLCDIFVNVGVSQHTPSPGYNFLKLNYIRYKMTYVYLMAVGRYNRITVMLTALPYNSYKFITIMSIVLIQTYSYFLLMINMLIALILYLSDINATN